MEKNNEPLNCKNCKAPITRLTGDMHNGHIYFSYICPKCGYRQIYKVSDDKRVDIMKVDINN